jgi:hypothetical protein
MLQQKAFQRRGVGYKNYNYMIFMIYLLIDVFSEDDPLGTILSILRISNILRVFYFSGSCDPNFLIPKPKIANGWRLMTA